MAGIAEVKAAPAGASVRPHRNFASLPRRRLPERTVKAENYFWKTAAAFATLFPRLNLWM
jgi:hypothetical protein